MSFHAKYALIGLLTSCLLIYSSPALPITLEAEIKEAKTLIEKLASVTPGSTAAEKVAMEIMHSYQCKKMLKSNEYKELGAVFHDLMYGPDGESGIAKKILDTAKAKLDGKYASLAPDLVSIRNKSSTAAKKPPMDLDFGVLAKDNDDLKRILAEITQNGGSIEDFHAVLKKELGDAFQEVGKELGLPSFALNPEKALIAGTTGFHPEAYKDVGAIKGDTPLAKWVGQSSDVSRYKINELQNLVEDGLLSAESAAQEAARGTVKDLDKLDRTFTSIARRTGKAPRFSKVNERLRIYLLKLAEADDLHQIQSLLDQIDDLTRGKGVFNACNDLVDNMEAAWKLLATESDPERLLKILFKDFLSTDDYMKAMKALENGNFDDLPGSIQNLRKEMFKLASTKRVSLANPTADTLLKNWEGRLMLRDVTGDTRQVLIDLLEQLDASSDPKLFNMVFGESLGEGFENIARLMSNNVKTSLIAKLASKVPLTTLDGKLTSLELGDGSGILRADAFIGIAMAYVEINGVMDRKLPPDEERRELQKAIVTNMPIVGDVLLGINNLVEGGYEGSWSKIAQSATYFVIGAAGFVPAFQMPALVAGLGMGAIQIGGLAWDAYWDAQLVNAWIKSGTWDKENGKLSGLNDSADVAWAINFESLVANFNQQYKYDYYGLTIRDSIFWYTEHRSLKGNKAIESFRDALTNLYPEAPVDEALRQPGKRGEGLIRAAIKLAGDGENIDRNLALAIYGKYKQEYDKAAVRAIEFLKSQAEKEYQARHNVGEALKVFQELDALGVRLGLPLVDRLNTLFSSFSSYVRESLKSPVLIDSLARRKVQLAERYLAGYLEIEARLASIRKMFQLAGIKTPSHNMTGYLEIDGPRIGDLEMSYSSGAIVPARKEVERAQRELSAEESYRFNPQNSGHCQSELFKTLAGILVRRVEAEDRRLLLEQWTGKWSAAEASRDRALQELQTAMRSENVEISVNPLNLVATAWKGKEVKEGLGQDVTISSPTLRIWNHLGDSFESAYAWANVRWEGSQVYEEAIETQNQRIKQLDGDFSEASNSAVLDLRFCLAKLPKIIVTFTVRHPVPGDRLFAEAKIISGEIPEGAEWQWQSQGEISLRDNGDMMAGLTAHGNGTVSVQLVHGEEAIAHASADLTVDAGEMGGPEEEPPLNQKKTEPPPLTEPDETDGTAGSPTKETPDAGGGDKESLPSTGESSIKAPSKVIAGKVFTVSVEPSGKLTGQVKHYKWGGPLLKVPDPYKKSYDGPQMKMLVHPRDAFPHERNIKNVKAVYIDVELLGASGEELDESQAMIPVQLVSLGVELPAGYNGGAAAIGFGADKLGQDGDSGWQSYSARFTLHWMSSGDDVPEGYDQALSIGEFTGRGKSEPLKYTRGSWGSGYVGCNAMQSLSGVVEKDGMRLKVTVVGSARGYWDCRNKDWVMSKGAAIFQEALALANAAAHLTPYGSKLPQVDTSKYAVTVPAKPTPSSPPQEKVGPFEVIGLPSNPVYGSQAGISLRDKGKKPGSWKALWQASEPGIEFDPPEGMNTKVTFGRMGSVMIWAQVLDLKDGSSVAEAQQVAARVIGPRFTLKLNPTKPRVGKEIRASISSAPGIPQELVNFKWSSPASSNRMEYNDPASEIGFSLKDAKPLKLKAEAVAPHYGDLIGIIEGSIQAALYTIKVTARKFGPPKLTWDPGKKGIVEAGSGVYLTGEEIRLIAVLEGTPEPGVVNWKWQVNEGVTISNSNSQTPVVSRSTAGNIQAEVVATNKDKVLLGNGSLTLSVSEPVREPGRSDSGTGTATQAEKFIAEAKKQAGLGKMVAAESAVEQARKLDSGAATKVARTVADAARKSGWKAAHQRDFPSAIQDLEVANRLNPADEDTRDKLRRAERFAGMWPQVEAKAREFDQLVAGKKVWSAQKVMLELQDLQYEMPGQMANPLSQKVMADFNQALQEYNAFITEKNSLHSQYFVEKNWQAMLENAEQSQTRELSVSDAKEAKSRMDFARQMLSESASTGQTTTESAPGQRASTAGGYPNIAGEWQEGPNRVWIVQNEGSITATCTYGSISWRMDGTITRDGVFTARLEHTAGVPSSATGFAQDRDLQLSPDGRSLIGTARFTGGSHPLKWVRPGSAADSSGNGLEGNGALSNAMNPAPGQWASTAGGYPNIAGEWQEGPNRVWIVQNEGSITATCTYGSISWRMDGTITRDGVFTARLEHTAGVPSSATGFAQDRDLQLNPDGRTLIGTARFTGGSHPLKWIRPGSAADSSGNGM